MPASMPVQHPSNVETWAIYKLMLTFDLFNIGELLYLDSMAL